jgi:hypothetical protein
VDLNPDAAYDCRIKSRKAKMVLKKEREGRFVKLSSVFVSFLYFTKACLLLRKNVKNLNELILMFFYYKIGARFFTPGCKSGSSTLKINTGSKESGFANLLLP